MDLPQMIRRSPLNRANMAALKGGLRYQFKKNFGKAPDVKVLVRNWIEQNFRYYICDYSKELSIKGLEGLDDLKWVEDKPTRSTIVIGPKTYWFRVWNTKPVVVKLTTSSDREGTLIFRRIGCDLQRDENHNLVSYSCGLEHPDEESRNDRLSFQGDLPCLWLENEGETKGGPPRAVLANRRGEQIAFLDCSEAWFYGAGGC